MAVFESSPTIELHLTMRITEPEARALEAMAGYGAEEFVKALYDKLGRAYMQQHESGLLSFLRSCHELIPSHLSRVSEARAVFTGMAKAVAVSPTKILHD